MSRLMSILLGVERQTDCPPSALKTSPDQLHGRVTVQTVP
jgi:hypothetical protein